MDFVVETGAGLADATSYASVAAAGGWIGLTPAAAAWAALSEAEQEARLILATILLDSRADWCGTKSVPASALRWPRTGCRDADGYAITAGAMPAALIRATAELATQVDRLDVVAGTARPVVSKTTGPTSVTYAGGGAKHEGPLPPTVLDLLGSLVRREAMLLRA